MDLVLNMGLYRSSYTEFHALGRNNHIMGPASNVESGLSKRRLKLINIFWNLESGTSSTSISLYQHGQTLNNIRLEKLTSQLQNIFFSTEYIFSTVRYSFPSYTTGATQAWIWVVPMILHKHVIFLEFLLIS